MKAGVVKPLKLKKKKKKKVSNALAGLFGTVSKPS
jgi:hypothetical protein